ncbi:MAG: hypothetical protein IPJ43_02565 [Saprospiraceae bacterium]|nr:hypothetical protein [Saprospiraceae bacterium]
MSTVNTTLLELMPKTLEDVDNFKKNKVASKVSGKVGSDIDAKAGGIDATFGKISEPAKADNPKESIPLGEIEEATETRKISLGADIVKPASEEAVDLSAYNDESENLMKKEGLTQEQLDMVDSGELAEAKTEKEGIKEKVESEPKAIRDEEKSLSDTVTQELDKKEQDGKKSMRSDREKGLKDSLTKQGETKTDLEKRRKLLQMKLTQNTN